MVRLGRRTHIVTTAALCALLMAAGCGNQDTRAAAPDAVGVTGSTPLGTDPAVSQGFANIDREITSMRRDVAGLSSTSGMHMMLLIALLLICAIGLILSLTLLSAIRKLRDAMPSGATRTEKGGMAERQYTDLVERLNRIESDVAKIKNSPSPVFTPTPVRAAPTPAPVSPIPADQNARRVPTPAPAPRPEVSLAQDITLAFNNIANPKDVEDFETHFGTISLSNNRNEDATRIFEDLRARFWLIEDPSHSARAYLIPGADTKKNWHKLKEPKSDHPLGYHFDLRAGDDLRIVRPAVVVPGPDGWRLEQKGILEGMG